MLSAASTNPGLLDAVDSISISAITAASARPGSLVICALCVFIEGTGTDASGLRGAAFGLIPATTAPLLIIRLRQPALRTPAATNEGGPGAVASHSPIIAPIASALCESHNISPEYVRNTPHIIE